MTSYPRSAYHSPFPAGTSPNGAASRGWGPGWPNCQSNKMKTIVAKNQDGTGSDIRISVRAEVAPMVANLLEATDKLYNVEQSDTGGYNCRPIAGTSTPSNHSWGLAIDINWNHNPRAAFHSEIPPAVVAMWNDCGWFWGGFYAHSTPDTMHFEYIGTPADVPGHTKKAAAYNKKVDTVTTLSGQQVLALAMAAGFTRAEANVMTVIAYYESGWNPNNVGDQTLSKYGSRGLWQIFTKVHDPVETGVSTTEHVWTDALIKKLEDPAANAHAAHVVFKSQGFTAWSTYDNHHTSAAWVALLNAVSAYPDPGTTTPPPTTGPTYVLTLGKNAKPGKIDKTNKDLQRALIATGFAKFSRPNPLGLYGKGTEAAVRAFFDKYPQFASGPTDTAIGPKGWTFLRALALKTGK